jgi:hypothetical protein
MGPFTTTGIRMLHKGPLPRPPVVGPHAAAALLLLLLLLCLCIVRTELPLPQCASQAAGGPVLMGNAHGVGY